MIRKVLTTSLALIVVAACADSPTDPDAQFVDGVLDAAWDYKITGSGTFLGGFVVSISLTEGLNGGTKGQIQYDGSATNGNEFHIDVDAFQASGNVYEMCGVMNVQAGSFGADGTRVGVAITDVDGGMDKIRVAAAVDCTGSVVSPSVVLESGDFRVREDL
jgi:hypothetical protein